MYYDESPVQLIMKIYILVDNAIELREFLSLEWKRLVAASDVNLFALDTLSTIVNYVEYPLHIPRQPREFNEFSPIIVHLMQNSTT